MSDTDKTQEAPEAPVVEWEVTAEAKGSAVVYVEAATEEEAMRIAYADALCGITIEGGEATWEITDCWEVGA